MSKRAFTSERVQGLLEHNLIDASVQDDSLRLENFNANYREISGPVQDYVKALMAGDKESPLFNFCSTSDFKNLSPGEEKWIGFIPWGLHQEDTRAYAEKAAHRLADEEKTRLELDESLVPKLQTLIRNGLISILHDNLRESRKVKVVNPKLQMSKRGSTNRSEGAEETTAFSYEEIRNAVVAASHEAGLNEKNPLGILLGKLGFITVSDGSEASSQAREVREEELTAEIERTKLDAIALYERLGAEIMAGQQEADLPGLFATINLRTEDKWTPYFDFLKKAFGCNGLTSEDGKDEYEAQTIAHLTYLLLRLRNHPVIKIRDREGPKINRNFIKDFYGKIGATQENKIEREVAFQKDGSPATSAEDAYNYLPLDCYKTTLSNFEDLSDEQKEVVRGDFRLKDEISILIKTLTNKQMLNSITDIDAGECAVININEDDLLHAENKDRLAEFMKSIAKEAALSFGANLTEADSGTSYKDLRRGTFKIEDKLKPDKGNTESFNFPAVKVYLNIPVEDPDDSEASIRVEFRILCGDTYIRGAHDKNSRSYHGHYKRKQAIKLGGIITPRAYSEQILNVAREHTLHSKKLERAEMHEIRTRRKEGKSNRLIIRQKPSPHSPSPAAQAPRA